MIPSSLDSMHRNCATPLHYFNSIFAASISFFGSFSFLAHASHLSLFATLLLNVIVGTESLKEKGKGGNDARQLGDSIARLIRRHATNITSMWRHRRRHWKFACILLPLCPKKNDKDLSKFRCI
jgi:hypothetical protein